MLLKERMEIAKHLYEKNHAKKLRFNHLAKYVGVSDVSVGFWFSGRTNSLDANCIFKVAEYFGVNPRWLVGEDVPMTKGEQIEEQSASVELDDD